MILMPTLMQRYFHAKMIGDFSAPYTRPRYTNIDDIFIYIRRQPRADIIYRCRRALQCH